MFKTTADEKRESAQEHIKLALEALLDITFNHVYGWDDFDDSYYKTLCRITKDLIDINNDI